MTAEVVIMNKLAVALAADSAVTITSLTGNNKIYNSANKLFALSRHCPVGMMIYGTAELMGMPWETIISSYREHLGSTKYDKLKDYADDFMNYLQQQTETFFPSAYQDAYFQAMVFFELFVIKQKIEERLTQILGQEKEINQRQRSNIVREVISSIHHTWKEAEDLPSVPENYVDTVIAEYDDVIRMFTKRVFDGFSVSGKALKQIKEICVFMTMKNVFTNYSGVVFAGFGEQEFFPSMLSFKVDSVTKNFLKQIEDEAAEISYFDSVKVKAFAQSEMVNLFLKGIHPAYYQTLWGYLQILFETYPEIILSSLPELEEKRSQRLLEKLQEVGEEMLRDFKTTLTDYQDTKHYKPVIDNVGNLPIDELAAMAESLVNITSFKRRVSKEEETVGGPIDVAVISKKDGFIWIKRKHYFKADLNRDYFANKYQTRGEASDD